MGAEKMCERCGKRTAPIFHSLCHKCKQRLGHRGIQEFEYKKHEDFIENIINKNQK